MGTRKIERLCIVSLFFFVPYLAFSLNIYLKDYIQYSTDTLYLRDVVYLNNSGGDTEAALLSLPLPFSSDRLHIIPAATIKKTIQSHYDGPFIIIGKKTVCIPTALVPQGADWFFKTLADFLVGNENHSEGRMEIELLSLPNIDYLTPLPHLRFRFQNKNMSNGYIAGETVLTGTKSPGTGVSPIVVRLRIHRFLWAAVPQRSLDKNERLLQPRLSFVQKDISEIHDDILLENMPYDHYIAREYLPAGVFITMDKLKTKHIINSGEMVNIIFTNGNVRIATRGQAREGGFIGSRIPVKPLDTQKIFSGTISADKEVMVELE
ncbi:MAG: flagellar basal body P-ring formation chaperone FlgA [Spirochaetia bacterium]